MKNMVRSLKNIKFPVFPIPTRGTVSTNDTKLIFTTPSGIVKIIDDSTLSGSFAIRRLNIAENNKILPLKKAIPSLGNLILYTRIYNTFIDSNGKLFKYKRKYIVPVICREIVDYIPYKSGTVLILKNIHCPIFLYRPLKMYEKYAVLAAVERGYILIGINTTDYLRKKTIKI